MWKPYTINIISQLSYLWNGHILSYLLISYCEGQIKWSNKFECTLGTIKCYINKEEQTLVPVPPLCCVTLDPHLMSLSFKCAWWKFLLPTSGSGQNSYRNGGNSKKEKIKIPKWKQNICAFANKNPPLNGISCLHKDF